MDDKFNPYTREQSAVVTRGGLFSLLTLCDVVKCYTGGTASLDFSHTAKGHQFITTER